MALSPIGNVTYVNQNSQVSAVQHANSMQKVDFALNANMQEFVDKLKAIQEVSPTPQVQANDLDSGQEKKRQSAQNQKKEKKELIGEIEDEVVCMEESHHILDIRA